MKRRILFALSMNPQLLGDEEEAWIQHRPGDESLEKIRQWLKERRCERSCSGSPLADDEDAWVRR